MRELGGLDVFKGVLGVLKGCFGMFLRGVLGGCVCVCVFFFFFFFGGGGGGGAEVLMGVCFWCLDSFRRRVEVATRYP